jgi:hypothetical protein
MQTTLLIFVALVFAVARFFMPTHPLSPHGSYEAFAHLFVGGLIGAWLVSRKPLYGLLAIALTLLELVAFFTLKML